MIMSGDFDKRLTQVEKDVKEIKETVNKILELCTAAFQDSQIDTILTTNQVAVMLGIDVNIIYAHCANGRMPYQRVGKKYRFKKSEVINWWQGQKKDSILSLDNMVEDYLLKNPMKG